MKIFRTIAAAMIFLGTPVHVTAAADDCKASGKLKVVVDLEAPAPQPAAGVKMLLRYPETVSLPGLGDSTAVKQRVTDLPSGFIASLNDQNGTFSVALASGTATAATGKLFIVEFDRCEGANAPSSKDFSCEVQEAVQDCGSPAGDVHCSVQIP